MHPLKLSIFEADITPPMGSPLCGGWIRPVEGVSDPLMALGLVLDWGEGPVVLCALDWCELRNDGHHAFREALASAVGTDPSRVAVQCVHQHNAPFVDPAAQRWIERQSGLSPLIDGEAFHTACNAMAASANASLDHFRTVTRVETGQANAREVASNRRVKGEDGAIHTRWSACTDSTLRAEPEGLIDPRLTSLLFWGDAPNGEPEKLAVLHHYATHPMSYYGDGQVTSDFMGLARQRRTQEDGGIPHLVLTGCAGNITAGKYNDGSPENRAVLTDRIHAAMVESERRAEDIGTLEATWRTHEVAFRPREYPSGETLLQQLEDGNQTPAARAGAALELAYREWSRENPVVLSGLSLNEKVYLLHLPGEPFVEYQLYAQSLRNDGIVLVAGYGDGGVGYLPLEENFVEGGYEPEQAFAEPASETLLKEALASLLA